MKNGHNKFNIIYRKLGKRPSKKPTGDGQVTGI